MTTHIHEADCQCALCQPLGRPCACDFCQGVQAARAARHVSDGDIESLYMKHCPDDSLAAALKFARAVLRAAYDRRSGGKQ